MITVSQLNLYIKKMFDSDLTFASVMLSGEISNFSPHYRTGHLYFSLKDENCSVKAVMFARDASRLRFAPENGMKVIAVGRVSVFERDGVYQLYVRELQPDGAGALAVAFEQLKKRLAQKGLFEEAHKKPLPEYPKTVGVVTSPNGAALQDILNILRRRWPVCAVVLAGVSVQGNTAAGEIVNALERLNRLPGVDVIIVARGGGSAEDLWCFNDEALAWAVYESRVPVVSGVGHETDFTICDLVADLRAPTPSAAAELVTPDITSETLRLEQLTEALFAGIEDTVDKKRDMLASLAMRRSFSSPERFFEADRARIASLFARLQTQTALTVNKNNTRALLLRRRLDSRFHTALGEEKLRFTRDVTALKKLDPLDVLLRGFAVAQTESGALTGVGDISPGDKLTVVLSDGSLDCRVENKTEGINGKYDV